MSHRPGRRRPVLDAPLARGLFPALTVLALYTGQTAAALVVGALTVIAWSYPARRRP
ncbi:MAG: hypothetical protein ACRDQ0_06005 [Pseudonocardia sp.]